MGRTLEHGRYVLLDRIRLVENGPSDGPPEHCSICCQTWQAPARSPAICPAAPRWRRADTIAMRVPPIGLAAWQLLASQYHPA